VILEKNNKNRTTNMQVWLWHNKKVD